MLVASYKASAEALVDWTNDIWLVAKTKKSPIWNEIHEVMGVAISTSSFCYWSLPFFKILRLFFRKKYSSIVFLLHKKGCKFFHKFSVPFVKRKYDIVIFFRDEKTYNRIIVREVKTWQHYGSVILLYNVYNRITIPFKFCS